jgi:hypothetical protein
MKKLLLPVSLLLVLFLSGCDKRPIDQQDYTIQRLDNIPELRGCIYLRLDSGNLKVIRCLNSTTSVQWTTGGKSTNTYHVVTIDNGI